MSSHHESPTVGSPEQLKPNALLKDGWSKLFRRKVTRIYDETAPSNEQSVGLRRADLTIAGGHLGVARYFPDYASRTAGLLMRDGELSKVESLIGHISFSKQLPSAGIEGIIYLTSAERTAGVLDIDIDRWRALSSDSQDCFEFADRIGLGGHWFTSVIEAEKSNEPYHSHQQVELKAVSQLLLGSALQEVQFT